MFTLHDVQDTGLIPGELHNTKYSSPYRLSWVNDDATNYTSNGTIVNLIFVISDEAVPGEYTVTVSAAEDGVISQNGSQPSCVFVNGKIIVPEEECGHSWGAWKRLNNTKHKRVCSLCDEVEYGKHVWDDGEVTEEPTEDSTGILIYACDICSGTKSSVIPALEPDEYNITGTITSYGDADEAVTVIMYDVDGTEIDSDTTTDGTYSLYAPDGTYTLEVSKLNHVTREYEITVDDNDVTQDVKLCLLGDVTGDGKVTLGDYGKVLSHVKKKSLLSGYPLKCADVTGDGKVTLGDYGKILSHVKKKSLLW